MCGTETAIDSHGLCENWALPQPRVSTQKIESVAYGKTRASIICAAAKKRQAQAFARLEIGIPWKTPGRPASTSLLRVDPRLEGTQVLVDHKMLRSSGSAPSKEPSGRQPVKCQANCAQAPFQWSSLPPLGSSREVRTRVPTLFCSLYPPPKKGKRELLGDLAPRLPNNDPLSH